MLLVSINDQGVLNMRKIIFLIHLSLDGYAAGPNGEMDWIVIQRRSGSAFVQPTYFDRYRDLWSRDVSDDGRLLA